MHAMIRGARTLLVGLTLAGAGTAWAQGYPNKPGRLIVTTAPGSTTDVVGRMLTEHYAKNLGQPWVVENRVGAGGNIGMSAAAKSAPDGYTLTFGSLGQSIINAFLYRNLDFDNEKDFDAVAYVAGVPYLVTVPVDSPIKTFADFLAAARARPGGVNIAIDSTSVRVAHALLDAAANIKTFPVSYNGQALAIADVLGGRVAVMIETTTTLRPMIDGGKLRPLAITTPTASPLAPGVASVNEQGVPNYGGYVGWFGVITPHGTPANAVNILNAETNKFLNLSETKARFQTLGLQSRPGTVQEFANYVASERARIGPIIKAAGMKAE